MQCAPFDEDEAEIACLTAKPTCFIIIGKPGSGKTTLATRFAYFFKCVFVSVPDAIQRAINDETEHGKEANKYLIKGRDIPEELSMKILAERLMSAEVTHHGYLLDGFPMLSNDLSIDDQLKFVQSLALKPDYIINLLISDSDLASRRLGLRVDPVTNQLYGKEFYVEQVLTQPTEKDEKGEELDREEMEEEEEELVEQIIEDSFDEDDFMDMDLDNAEVISAIKERLMVRVEELDNNIATNLQHYKEQVLPKLDDYMMSHCPEHIIELDATLSAKDLYKNLLIRVNTEMIHKAFVPVCLQGEDSQEEISDDADADEILRSLAACEMVAPGFRWKRSRWGCFCPVSLCEGLFIPGSPKFAVGFLDKMYLMASFDAMQKFLICPRKYIVPPQPCPPCKFVVLGAPLSDTSTFCQDLKDRYKCHLINLQPLFDSQLKDKLDNLLSELQQGFLSNAIEKVKNMDPDELEQAVKTLTDEEVSDEKLEINEQHPLVREAFEASVAQLKEENAALSPEDCITCLEETFEELYKDSEKDFTSGGWIIDNFPKTKDQFVCMVNRGIAPDEVFVFEDDSKGVLQEARWNEEYRGGVDMESMSEVEKQKYDQYKTSCAAFDGQWKTMQAMMINENNIEPLIIYYSMSKEEALAAAVKKIEGAFKYVGWAYTGMDQDEEEEDFLAIESEGTDDDDNDDIHKSKSFGETQHFCPVALKEDGVLCPGTPEWAVKYREKIYFLSSDEHRETFLADPEVYLPHKIMVEIPPVRLLLLGVSGSGKTLHGRLLAKRIGVFHISFKERLQELILPKTGTRIGPDYEHLIEEKAKNEESEEVEEEVVKELDLTEFEQNIYDNIMRDEPLTKETLDKIVLPWWKEEPFRSQGIILEGFPRTLDETRYLADAGLYPDAALLLVVSNADIFRRLSPPVIQRWQVEQDRQTLEKERKRSEKMKFFGEEKSRRKVERMKEREAERYEEDEEEGVEMNTDDAAFEEELDEIIDSELLEEFGEIEDDMLEDEETEEDAVLRIKEGIEDKYDAESESLETVQDTLVELMLPCIEIDAGKKVHITQYFFKKMLKSQVQFRSSLFDRFKSITMRMAKRLLRNGYMKMSRFGKWCPVQLLEGAVIPPFVSPEKPTFPTIYRNFIYFLSSEEARLSFTQSPKHYLAQASPKPLVPMKIAVLGSPKSGKTTLAARFANDHGLIHLSIGEATRRVLVTNRGTSLARDIEEHLRRGVTLPDELAVQALELCLLDPICTTRGYVLDGYPITFQQVQLMQQANIIPYKVIELHVTDASMMKRGSRDRKAPTRVHPLHDSHTALAARIAYHRKHARAVREFYADEYNNLSRVFADDSKWMVYHNAFEEVSKSLADIQTYIERNSKGLACPIRNMCVTPNEFYSMLGEFGQYCPVSWTLAGELVDCSCEPTNDLVAEYAGKYYKFPTREKLELFMETPQRFVGSAIRHRLPSESRRPVELTAASAENLSIESVELKGYCPVTYLEGKLRYEHLTPGQHHLAVKYNSKTYRFASPECLEKFMRFPNKYHNLPLPKKLPPCRDQIDVNNLPRLGYLEQTVANMIIRSMTSVGNFKPKLPFLSAKRSALTYLAYYLKAYNAKSSDFVRQKYKKRLQEFENDCQLAKYLSGVMSRKFLEPEDRPVDFDRKLAQFESLK